MCQCDIWESVTSICAVIFVNFVINLVCEIQNYLDRGAYARISRTQKRKASVADPQEPEGPEPDPELDPELDPDPDPKLSVNLRIRIRIRNY